MFSGSVYGGVFDKTDESIVIYCSFGRLAINMKDKTLKYYHENELGEIYKINKENEVSIEGVNKTKTMGVVIYRHQIKNEILLQFGDIKEGKLRVRKTSKEIHCVIGDKKF